jgi:UDP-N-acetylmuramoyl-L-alanyl-D-glutamate--2,6-diaminopimelate ligase
MDTAASASDVEITGLSADSRKIERGYLFAALDGSLARGSTYIPQAVANGAVAVLAPEGTRLPAGSEQVSLVTHADPRRALALAAARFYGTQPRIVAAVTGTNGKTSVADFTRQIWHHAGLRAASLGTLGVISDEGSAPAMHTTPDPVTLHETLSDLATRGVDHLALEASSHGLDQRRLDGVEVSAAAFTNISHDHRDYHPTEAAYFDAKARLFSHVMPPGGSAVLNADIPEAAKLTTLCKDRGHKVLTFGETPADIHLRARHGIGTGQDLELDVLGEKHNTHVPLACAFQAHNLMAALGLAISTGVALGEAIAALAEIKGVRGRLEEVARHPNQAAIFVDYAHTPDALAVAIAALRPHVRNNLAVVFGCGGDRDKGKRAEMGAIAAAEADRIYVTDDNPRTEDPARIRRAIMKGCPGATEVGDRATAIGEAVNALQTGDILLIAGKGHEQGQIVGEKVIPFDDADIARRAVAGIPAPRGAA